MKGNDGKNFKVQVEEVEKDNEDNASGTCVINNAVSDATDENKAGLLDKTGAM